MKTFSHLNPPPVDLPVTVAEWYLSKPSVLQSLARIVVGGREGRLGDDVYKGPTFCAFHFAPKERFAGLKGDVVYQGEGAWCEKGTGTVVRAESSLFAVDVQLGTIDPKAIDSNGLPAIIVTDLEDVTEQDVAQLKRDGIHLARLGDGYKQELKRRLDESQSPVATLPEV